MEYRELEMSTPNGELGKSARSSAGKTSKTLTQARKGGVRHTAPRTNHCRRGFCRCWRLAFAPYRLSPAVLRRHDLIHRYRPLWNGLQFGQAGIMSLGYAALMGFGAYTAAILSRDLGMACGTRCPHRSCRGHRRGPVRPPSLTGQRTPLRYYHLGMCELLRITLINGGKFTGAATGLDAGPIGKAFGLDMDKLAKRVPAGGRVHAPQHARYYLIANSRYGRTLRSIRENEQLARAIGVNTDLLKLSAFMLSGVFAGVAGDLQAYNFRHISPTSMARSACISR